MNKEKFSKTFEIVIILTVIVCLLGMIYCCISFVYTLHKFTKENTSILHEISSCFTPDTQSEIASSSSTSKLSVNSFDMSSNYLSNSSLNKEDVSNLISHMENMIAIQKSGITNDLMSFIYGILSTILVGLCAKFVEKSRSNADQAKEIVNETKKNAEIAQLQADKATEKAKETGETITLVQEVASEARKNAETAQEQADKATEKAKETGKTITLVQEVASEARKNAETAQEQAKKAIEKAKETEDAITQAHEASKIAKILRYQVKLLIISSRIISAKSALLELKNISANRSISQIRGEIIDLFNDSEFTSNLISFYDIEIGKVYDDLLDLGNHVDVFLDLCKERYTDKAALDSMESAAKNYRKWIDFAIKNINDASKKMRPKVNNSHTPVV